MACDPATIRQVSDMSEARLAQKPTRIARALLARPERTERVAPLLAAAAFFAGAALALATTVMMLPTPWPR